MKLTEMIIKKQWIAVVTLLLVFGWVNSAAAQEENPWQFEATLYLWLTDIDGTMKDSGTGLPGGPFEIDTSTIIDSLSMVFMGAFEARKDKWSMVVDGIYLDIGNEKNTTVTGRSGIQVDASVDLDISAWVLTGAVGYDLMQADKGTLAAVGGVRYLNLATDVTLGIQGRQAESSSSEGLLDGIVGVRGAINLNENWYIPYYADIGTGQSDLTWQALAGIGYRFGWGDVRLVYRYLDYQMDDDKPLQDLTVSGLVLGVGFRF